jgi:cobalamin biosynthesis Mg chelatase CobN
MRVEQHLITNFARGSSGGGARSSGGVRSTTSRSTSTSRSTTRSSSTSKTSTKPAAPKTGTSKAKPGSTIKTASGQTIKSSTKKPANAKYASSKGIVGDNGYTPRFTNGYSAPAGSVVYYPQHSALDYLPWIYLFSSQSPTHDQAVVVQPDGKEVQAKPVAGGTDGMMIFNWIVLILIVAAICAGIVYLVNKLTKKAVPRQQFYL